MITLIGADKVFDKIQHLFMIKALNKLGIEGMYFNIIKAIYEKTHRLYDTQWWKAEVFCLRPEKR